jgi:hypothetical protein
MFNACVLIRICLHFWDDVSVTRMVGCMWMINLKDVEGSNRVLFELISLHLPEVSEEIHEHLKIAGMQVVI